MRQHISVGFASHPVVLGYGAAQEINRGPYTDPEREAERLSSARLSEMPWRWGEAEVSAFAKGQQSWVNFLIWVGIPKATSKE